MQGATIKIISRYASHREINMSLANVSWQRSRTFESEDRCYFNTRVISCEACRVTNHINNFYFLWMFDFQFQINQKWLILAFSTDVCNTEYLLLELNESQLSLLFLVFPKKEELVYGNGYNYLCQFFMVPYLWQNIRRKFLNVGSPRNHFELRMASFKRSKWNTSSTGDIRWHILLRNSAISQEVARPIP